MRVLVIHGPSLSLLGRREPAVYGAQSLDDVDGALRKEAEALAIGLWILQTNHEGAIVDALLQAATADEPASGVVLNAAAYAHTSLAIADAVRAIAPIPVVEVHLSNTAARALSEPMRGGVVVGAACLGRIEGLGVEGYLLALRALARRAKGA